MTDPGGSPPTTAEIFDRLREALVDVMGSAATATFLRRAVRTASRAQPTLASLGITKHQLDYTYVMPPDWAKGRHELPALVELAAELNKLLLDHTGVVVVRRLRSVPLLAETGLFRGEEGSHV